MSQANDKLPEPTTTPTETAVKKSSSESTSADAPPSMPAGFPGNPFDFSSMAGLLNDPSVKELAEQIAKDPSFNQMAEQLQKTFQGGEGGIPQFDTQQYYTTMQQVMQNPQFMSMAERLGSALMQDPSMSQMLESLSNPAQKDQLEERMARIKEDPSLKHILEEIETGGPTAMMKYWNDKDVLQKLGEAMGLPVTGDPNAFAGNSGDGEAEEVNEDESIVHQTASVGDVEAKRDNTQPCFPCNGTGAQSCRFCTGSGNVTVELGGGEKEVSRCINCDGAGALTCTTCQGSGIQPRYLDRREFKDDD